MQASRFDEYYLTEQDEKIVRERLAGGPGGPAIAPLQPSSVPPSCMLPPVPVPSGVTRGGPGLRARLLAHDDRLQLIA